MGNSSHRPVTDHARQRITERTSLSLSRFKKKASYIFKHGYKLSRFIDPLYSYLCSKRIDGGFYDIRVWETYVFIYDTRQKRLLTVYPVPEEYLPVDNFLVNSGSPCILWLCKDGVSCYVCEGDSLTDDIGEAIEFRTKQKAMNYIKNNNTITVLVKQGWRIIVL